MNALVVYETLFGNARMIAQAIGEGLAEHCDVAVVDVRDADPTLDEDIDLLVVGGPTHQLGMTRPGSRRQAAGQYPEAPEARQVGLREWITELRAPNGCGAAAFDTRLRRPKLLRLLDHAAGTEQRLLRRRGLRIVAPAASFLVEDAIGPLTPGERDRARAWGQTLSRIVTANTSR